MNIGILLMYNIFIKKTASVYNILQQSILNFIAGNFYYYYFYLRNITMW